MIKNNIIKRFLLTRKINRAFGIKLTKSQKDFIFKGYNRFIPGERKQGKTLAHIIRLNLIDRPIDGYRLKRGGYNDELIPGYTRFYLREFKKIRQMLIDAGIDVADIR